MRRFVLVLAAGCLTSLAGGSSAGAGVTGTLTPAYGPPLVVQTTQTTLDSRSPDTQFNQALGSELDAAYAYASGDTLYLFLAGNMSLWVQLEGGIPHWWPMDVFLDTRPGGQNTLLANNPTIDPYFADLTKMAGLTFDPGFAPDYWFSLAGSQLGWPQLSAYEATLPSGGGGAGTFLGIGTCAGPGTLAGGSNPYGILVTLDDSNVGGVTQGCGASSGTGVTTGIEWAIPLAALGNPTGCIGICAVAANSDHSQLFNQVLGPLPSGTCDLGATSAVNFGAIAGNQFFTVCPQGTPANHPTWGALKARYR